MPTPRDAINFALEKHGDSLNEKSGELYFLHVLRVMLAGQTEAERIVGVLHDVIEDTDASFDDIRAMGFDEEIVAAVDAMTNRKDQGETYDEFIQRCKADPIARRVKLNDLRDNMEDLGRLVEVTDDDRERLEKYRGAELKLMHT